MGTTASQEEVNPSQLTSELSRRWTKAAKAIRGPQLLFDGWARAVVLSSCASLWGGSSHGMWAVGQHPPPLQGASKALKLGGRASVIVLKLQKSHGGQGGSSRPRSRCQGRQGQAVHPACHRLGRGSASLTGSELGSAGAVSRTWAWCRPSPPRFSEQGPSQGPAARPVWNPGLGVEEAPSLLLGWVEGSPGPSFL